jgi:hypothetical protein
MLENNGDVAAQIVTRACRVQMGYEVRVAGIVICKPPYRKFFLFDGGLDVHWLCHQKYKLDHGTVNLEGQEHLATVLLDPF